MSNGLIRIEDLHDSVKEPQYDTPQTTIAEVTRFNCLNKNLVSLVITGKTIVNLLGVAGDCEDVSLWSNTNCTTLLDSSNKVIRSNAIKITTTTTSDGIINKGFAQMPQLDITKYYGISAYFKNGNLTNGIAIYKDISNGGTLVTSENVTDTSKFNRVFFKLKPSDMVIGNYLNIIAHGTAVGQYAWVDAIQIEEITQAQYDDPNWQPSPYVTNDTSVGDTPARIRSVGKNLTRLNLPHLFGKSSDMRINSIIPTVQSDGYIKIMDNDSSDAYHFIEETIYVKPNTRYTISFAGKQGTQPLWFYAHQRSTIYNTLKLFEISEQITTETTKTYTIATLPDTKFIAIGFMVGNTTVNIMGDAYYKNVKVEEGDTATPYEPYQETVMPIPYPLRSLNGITDTQDTKKGKVYKRVEKVVLDGSHSSYSISVPQSTTGQKRVDISLATALCIVNSECVLKYNNKILTNIVKNEEDWKTDVSQIWPNGNTSVMSIVVSNSESGWGDSYTPTSDEIKAYFFGWRMYDGAAANDGTFAPIYNRTDGLNKMWCPIPSWDGTRYWNGQSALPTSMATKFTPYRLYYKLATEQELDIPAVDLVAFLGGSLVIENDAQSWVRPKIDYVLNKNNRANLESLMQDVVKNANYKPLNGVYATTQDIKYYVDSSKGDDVNNNGLSPDKPFKTIMKAVNSLPQVINHIANIYVANGTYDEEVKLQGFLGKGTIYLTGNEYIIDNCKIANIRITNNTCRIVIKGICTNTHGVDVGFWVYYNPGYVYIGYCKTTTLCSRGFEVENVSNAYITHCDINSSWRGIWCVFGNVISDTNTSSSGSNQYGLTASSGTITKIGTQPSGTVGAEFTENGGVIR